MVERIAAMLNYFLLYLAGPERRKLKVKDPEKLGWNPKELLSMITEIYLNLFNADKDEVFVTAIAADLGWHATVSLAEGLSELVDAEIQEGLL